MSRPEAEIDLVDPGHAASPGVIPPQRDGGDIASLRARIAESRSELATAASLTERARIFADITREQQRLIDLQERDGAGTGEGEIAGTFGSVSVMPRAAESGPGTLVIVDTSEQTDGLPVVVMVNDEVIQVPVEEPDVREFGLREIDAALERQYAAADAGDSADEEEVQRLSARGAALAAVHADPGCSQIDLDWGDDGLVAVASRDVFGDAGPAPDAPMVDVYASNLRPGHEACDGFLTARPGGGFRLDVDAALDRSVF